MNICSHLENILNEISCRRLCSCCKQIHDSLGLLLLYLSKESSYDQSVSVKCVEAEVLLLELHVGLSLQSWWRS